MNDFTGVLLDKRVLLKALRRKPIFERVDLYARAAKELGCKVVIFDAWSIHFERNAVHGYVPDDEGVFQRQWVPLPKVIHNRSMIGKTRAELRVLKRLANRGVHVFNPLIDPDKYRVHKLLYENEELRRYLPDTIPLTRRSFAWFKSKLLANGEVFIKPRRGSLGQGIARVRRIRPGLYRFESSRGAVLGSLMRMWKLTRRFLSRRCLLQVGIPLAQIGDRRFDLRVPVQKDASAAWRVPGMAAKRSESHPFLTNIARGGSALKIGDAIGQGIAGANAASIIKEVEKLALTVAQTLSHRYPRLADIGLDIGLDKEGNPFLIEMNRRDLRIILAQAGEDRVYSELYRNPLAYASHVARTG